MKFQAVLHAIPNQGVPPTSFLLELIQWGKFAPDEIFAPNNDPEDVFNRLFPILGPWESELHRRAALMELMRCLAGMESSWKWNEGVDITNKTSMRLITGQETGIFQVSWDSLGLDLVGPDQTDDLHQCVKKYCDGGIGVQTFIDRMKSNHLFALEYAARLLRNSYFWDGPIKRHEIDKALWKPAVREFMALVSAN